MNKTKVTKRKGSKTRKDNESAEVFVLPPNLLEQLGIDLGNIGSAQETATESQVTDINITSKNKSESDNKLTPKKHSNTLAPSCIETESSIIETAELMKKSVLLSPTFISNSTSIIQGEIEIIGNAKDLGDTVDDGLVNNEDSHEKQQETSIDMHRQCVSVSHVHTPKSTPISSYTLETKQCDKIANVNIDMQDFVMQTVLDDHADEAYSSDCSNSNVEFTDKSDNKKSNRNKINIISEQIILPPDFYKLKSSYSMQENTLIHVPINTMINSHAKNGIYHQNVLNRNLIIPNETTDIECTQKKIVYDGDLNAQNCDKRDSIISTMKSKVLQDLNKIDACAVLNGVESKFIIRNVDQEELQQNIVTIKTDVDITRHIATEDLNNHKNKEEVDFTSNTERYSVNDDKETVAFKVIATASYEDGNKCDSTVRSNAMAHDSKYGTMQKNILVSCVSDTEDESKNSKNLSEYHHSPMIHNVNTKLSPPVRNDNQKLSDMKEFKTTEQKTDELIRAQTGEADFINVEKDNFAFGKQPINQSIIDIENVYQSMGSQGWSGSKVEIRNNIDKNKVICTTDTLYINECNPDKNTRRSTVNAETSIQSPILAERYKKQKHGKFTPDNDHNIQSDILECSEPRDIKINHNENGGHECNNVTVSNMNLNVVQEDKVREIAKYLSKFADLQKRNNFNERRKTCSTKTSSNKKHATHSKSSIQGVEKPGGSGLNSQDKNYSSIVTYGRKRRQRCKTLPLYVFKDSDAPTPTINLTDSSTFNNTCNEMELCLCYDFGRLVFYDSENSYEHIHFWNNARTGCTSDIIFSIYSEDASTVTIDNYVKSDKDEYPSEISHTITNRKLCWNEIKLNNENKLDHDYDLDFNGKRNERIENDIHKRDKTNSQMVDGNFFYINKCKERTETEIELDCQNRKTTVNLILNGEEAPNIKDGHSKKTSKKRKISIIRGDNDEPPAKKSIFPGVEIDPVKDSSTSLYETATNSVQRLSINAIASGQQSSEQLSTTTSNPVDQPFTSLNQATIIPEGEPKITVNRVTTNQLPMSANEYSSTIICGVCQQSVDGADWIHHITSQHNYLAWKHGDPSLDVNDKAAVLEHLSFIAKSYGRLECVKCGLTRRYAKSYLSHLNSCSGMNEPSPEVLSGKQFEELGVKHELARANADLVKCGVCEASMQSSDWTDHIASQHDYLAWKCGDPSLDVNDEAAVREHLYELTKACGGLTCAKCGITRKYVKAFLCHIRSCSGLSEYQNDSACNISSEIIPGISNNFVEKIDAVPANTALIKCAVCEESLQFEDWNHHIASRHDYLAWKQGDPPLDVKNEVAVREHLYEITKACGGLTCPKCGLTRKYVKAYMSHIKCCNGLNVSQHDDTHNISSDDSPGMELNKSSIDSIPNHTDKEKCVTVNATLAQCSVCKEKVQDKDWHTHIALRHDYLAWKLGEPELNVNDEAAVRDHLYEITNACGGLTCGKCGLTRKYVRAYLNHFKNCNGLNESQNISACNISTARVDSFEMINSSDASTRDAALVKCAVCADSVLEDDWNNHIASRHNYLAWKSGDLCLDINDDDAVRQHLINITKTTGGLKCAKCGIKKKHVKSYMDHVKDCQTSGDVDAADDLVKCGVCGQYVVNIDWVQHIATNHEYLAWKDGEPPFNVNDAEEIRVHLQKLVKEIGPLACPKCGLQRKYAKSYLQHLSICGNGQNHMNDSNNAVDDYPENEISSFKCGACNETVEISSWENHLSEKHNYLAWKEGETPLDVDDEEQVYQSLYNFNQEFGCLICKHCGKSRKYVKSYLYHIKTCDPDVSMTKVESLDTSNTENSDEPVVDFSGAGTCGVCQKDVEAGKWIQHTQKDHNYLAWREGEKPWNLDNFADVNQYLYVICKRMDGLTCNKCGIVRKYVKTYLTHIKTCNVKDFNVDPSVSQGIGPVTNKELYQCAMCKEQIKPADWNTHAMENHYNVTWIIGETPIDIKNPYAVERYLKEYKQVYGRLKCNTCGATRASFAGFYAHIITCGKTEEEIDMFRVLCEICNNKYLCIYKNQHAMIHKVQMYTAELKTKAVVTKQETVVSGKRRAAVKARSVIENYSDNMGKHAHTCQSCGFGTDFQEEIEKHRCEVSNEKDFSGDESSAAEIGSSDDESPDSDVDSNISNEVNDTTEFGEDGEDDDELQEPKKKIRFREPAPVLSKVTRIPFKVEVPNLYIREGDEVFCNIHLTDEVLFPLWQCEYTAVPEPELARYLPPLDQSCKVKSDSGWTTLKRFESKRIDNGIRIFVGASIACIAWAPLRVEDIDEGKSNFLAIACHNGADCPRYQGDETPKHENLIQIWHHSASKGLLQIVFGIAHDFGTVWSMSWCPSGARDASPGSVEVPSRLGLLAVACSSGSAYIFAIPYLSIAVKNNQFIHKLKPVAELRMAMGTERKLYQATSVSWSKQKGHKIVLVGYADGSTAYYDLNSNSPLLWKMENNIQVFYPYLDERPHNTCITGTDLYPVSGLESAGAGAGAGASASAAPTGATLAARGGAGAAGAGGRARLQAAASAVAFAPHAASAVLAGDDAIMHTAISELAWVPPGRRLGSVRALAGCERCGRVVASMPPTLRVMRPHPAYSDLRKQVVGMLEVTHLAKKRKKQVNDELAMKIEPLTYADTISKYGIEFKTISRLDKAMQQKCLAKPKAHCPERFPLADIASMAFCPSRKYHDKLAVGTHSGILFLMTVS